MCIVVQRRQFHVLFFGSARILLLFFSPCTHSLTLCVAFLFSLHYFVLFRFTLLYRIVLDRISLSRNIINQFYLYKPYFENIRSCINCLYYLQFQFQIELNVCFMLAILLIYMRHFAQWKYILGYT